MDRITPEELRGKLEAGEPIAIVDLRHRLEFEADPRTLPGALRFDMSDLAQRQPRSRATATSSSTAPDRARPRAPVWRSCSGVGGSRACGRWPGGFLGWRDAGIPDGRRARPARDPEPASARDEREVPRTPPAMRP